MKTTETTHVGTLASHLDVGIVRVDEGSGAVGAGAFGLC